MRTLGAPASSDAFKAARAAFARGDLRTAELICRELVTTAPDDAQPWSLISEMALRRGRPDAAMIAAEHAVFLGPHDPFALLMHAKCLALAARTREALQAARHAAEIADLPPAALDGLGAVFSMLGRYDQALVLFKRAVEDDPRQPQYLYNLAAAERMKGAFAAAETHCDQALAIDPHDYRTHFLRSDLRSQTFERNHIAAMEALLAGGVRNGRGEVMLRYALGKECEDLGEYGRAIRHIMAGASLYRRSIRYDVADEIAAIDRIIGSPLPVSTSAIPATAAPIFVVGLPRSGTTVVERMLASHPKLVSGGELGQFPRLLAQQGAKSPMELAALGGAYLEAVLATGIARSQRFIDKTLQNWLHCGLVHAALPDARIIVVRRHPMDTCFAMFKAHFEGTFLFSYDLRELGAYYLAFDRLVAHWRATLSSRVLIEANYEDIIADPEREGRRLLDFIGLPWDDQVLRFHESRAPATTASAVQVRRPLYSSSVERWLHYAEALAPLREVLEGGAITSHSGP